MINQLIFILVLTLLVVCILPDRQNIILSAYALLGSTIGFLLSICLWINFNNLLPSFQFVTSFLGLSLGVDGISLHFILLTTFLFPICILISWGPLHTRLFLICFLVIEILLVLVFTVLDLFWFYIFFESILIPIFLVIGIWGSRTRKIRAAYLFFIFTLVGSLFILCSILYIYAVVGNTIYLSLIYYPFTFMEEKWLWLGFFLAFAVKVPIVPFHIWLPEAHVEAPTPASAILAGILLKLGIYGFVRYSIPLFPIASVYYTPLVFTLGLISIFYASVTAIRQTDLKRILAYASVAHTNIVVLGIFSGTAAGIYGCIIQSLSHGFVSAGLFLLIGTLYDRYHTRLFLYYGGLAHVIPIFSLFFLLLTLANVSLPGTSSFVGEFLVLVGLFEVNPFVCVLSACSLVLGAIYSFWLLNRMLYGNLKLQYLKSFTDLNKREVIALIPLLLIVFYMGVWPGVFLENLHSAVNFWTHFFD